MREGYKKRTMLISNESILILRQARKNRGMFSWRILEEALQDYAKKWNIDKREPEF